MRALPASQLSVAPYFVGFLLPEILRGNAVRCARDCALSVRQSFVAKLQQDGTADARQKGAADYH
jgi:hypothetical protein